MRITFILQLTGNFVLISCLRNTIKHQPSYLSHLQRIKESRDSIAPAGRFFWYQL